MDSTAKAALAVGGGVVAAKVLGNNWWLLAGVAAAVFVAKSPTTQAYLKKGASSVYSAYKAR
jgi:hypothetical protein